MQTCRAFISETHRGFPRRYAIVLRLQDRGSPSCAAHSYCAWKTGADPPWCACSPGQALRLRTPCVAWAPAQAFVRCRGPAPLENPGRAVRGTPVHRAKGPPDPLQCSGSPVAWAFTGTIPSLRTPCGAWAPAQAFLAWAFAGTTVHRTVVLVPAHPPDCCLSPAHPPDTRLIPAHPWRTRTAGGRSSGPSALSASPLYCALQGAAARRSKSFPTI